MVESASPMAGNVEVLGRPTPMVLSVARRLREAFAQGKELVAPDEPRVVRLASTTDAQQAVLTFAGSGVTVAADSLVPAEASWDVRWPDPVPLEIDGDALDGVAGELQALLAGPDVDWRSAAESFWERTNAMPGMPDGLVVYCFDEDALVELGDASQHGYAFLGSAVGLARMFGGRSLVMEELVGGELALDGSASHLSALIGANLKVVCGEL